MSNASNRTEGVAEEIGGKVKKTVGAVIGNEQMQAEGKAKELQGEARQEAAKTAERAKGKVEEVVGAVKNKVGAVIGNEQMQAEGKAKELQGEARQAANKP
ncbi:MAG: CsbD family protein [Labilithrix sp.]